MVARVGVWVGVVCLLTAGMASANVLSMGPGLTSLETVPVGNINNPADTTGYGSVSYTYNIGKYEVTAGQYTEFLNKVAGVDTYGLYNPYMWSDPYGGFGCKIERFAGSGTTQSPYQYRVAADYANRPVNYVSFWDSCRFANWLHHGQPSGFQGNSTTEDGSYTLTAEGISNNTVSRNGNWQWAVTSDNEWYRAAYYDPYKAGGAGYWQYPTRSNTAPGQDMSDATGNNANYDTAPYAYPIDNGHYTAVVGEFHNSASAYGTFDQGGNVWEWNEEIIPFQERRGLRGGSFNDICFGLHSSYSGGGNYGPPAEKDSSNVGFRVVQVPEPATIVMAALASIGILRRKRA